MPTGALSVVNIQHSRGCSVVFSWYGKQIIGAHFRTPFSTIFLFFDVPQYSNRFDYYFQRHMTSNLVLTTTKTSLHIIFNNFQAHCGHTDQE